MKTWERLITGNATPAPHMAVREVENAAIGATLVLTDHARQRWGERFDVDLTEALASAVPFGVQCGEALLLKSGEAVFATQGIGKGRRIVLTVMPASLAIANMESRGVRIDRGRARPAVHAPDPFLNRQVSKLATLAADHAMRGVGKESRLAALRTNGYDPAGKDGDAYRCAFEAATLVLKSLRESLG